VSLLYIKTTDSLNHLPEPPGIFAISLDENVEARLADLSVAKLQPLRDWLYRIDQCLLFTPKDISVRLTMTTSALEEAVSGFDSIDMEQVLTMESARAQRVFSRLPAPTSAATPDQIRLVRLAIYERALYVLVAAAEISFVRVLHRDNVRNKALARKNIEAFRRWRDETFGSHTPSISTLMCISAIGGHEPSYRALKITSPPDLLLNAAFDAARLEELGASVQNAGRFGFFPDVAIFVTMDRDLGEAFERFTLNSSRRSLDISAQTPWLHERRRKETHTWYMNLSPVVQMDRLRARKALTAVQGNLGPQVPGSLFRLVQALDAFAHKEGAIQIDHATSTDLASQYYTASH
jgi:hypothetical protein